MSLHMSIQYLFGDICKHVRTRPDAANAASDQGLQCLFTGISTEKVVKVKVKKSPETPKTTNGLIQTIRMDQSTGQNMKRRCIQRDIFFFNQELLY